MYIISTLDATYPHDEDQQRYVYNVVFIPHGVGGVYERAALSVELPPANQPPQRRAGSVVIWADSRSQSKQQHIILVPVGRYRRRSPLIYCHD